MDPCITRLYDFKWPLMKQLDIGQHANTTVTDLQSTETFCSTGYETNKEVDLLAY